LARRTVRDLVFAMSRLSFAGHDNWVRTGNTPTSQGTVGVAVFVKVGAPMCCSCATCKCGLSV
jgi:hypothetical protein